MLVEIVRRVKSHPHHASHGGKSLTLAARSCDATAYFAAKLTFRIINGSGVTNKRVLSGVIKPE